MNYNYVLMKSRFEKVIDAIKEKEKEINNNLHQDIFVEIRDGTILICSHKVLWKPKK